MVNKGVAMLDRRGVWRLEEVPMYHMRYTDTGIYAQALKEEIRKHTHLQYRTPLTKVMSIIQNDKGRTNISRRSGSKQTYKRRGGEMDSKDFSCTSLRPSMFITLLSYCKRRQMA
jgi:hypothetical protein